MNGSSRETDRFAWLGLGGDFEDAEDHVDDLAGNGSLRSFGRLAARLLIIFALVTAILRRVL